jgi:hypothetical protein
MKYEELYKRFLKALDWSYSDGVERFLEWCEREGIEIIEGGKKE